LQPEEIYEKEIPVSDVQLGMHIVRLDRPWSETDFPLQGFVVRTTDEIEAVQTQCETVVVEGRVSYRMRLARHAVATAGGPKKTERVKEAVVSYINQIPFEDEFERATEAFNTSRRTARNIFESVRLGRVLDIHDIRPVVKDVVASVLRNEAALRWLTQIRTKDGYTAEHSMNVCVLAAAFGRHLELPEQELELLALCGLLHDVGKVRCDEDVLTKSGALTPAEFEHLKMHPDFGRKVLMSVDGLENIAVDVAHSHHERMDGSGYPRGLTHEKIPHFAKIITVVDAYDAITAHRSYDNARSSKMALDIIYKYRGTQFDDDLALEFIRFIGIYPPGSLVELSSGEVGLVLESFPQNRLRPKVLIVRDANKAPCPEKVVNLMTLHVANGQPVKISREWPNGSFDIDLKYYLAQGLKLKEVGTPDDTADIARHMKP